MEDPSPELGAQVCISLGDDGETSGVKRGMATFQSGRLICRDAGARLRKQPGCCCGGGWRREAPGGVEVRLWESGMREGRGNLRVKGEEEDKDEAEEER